MTKAKKTQKFVHKAKSKNEEESDAAKCPSCGSYYDLQFKCKCMRISEGLEDDLDDEDDDDIELMIDEENESDLTDRLRRGFRMANAYADED